MEYSTKLTEFMNQLEIAMNSVAPDSLNALGRDAGRRGYHQIGVDPGRRFDKVWAYHGQKSVRYFVEKATGIIFGAKSWKAYNQPHVRRS